MYHIPNSYTTIISFNNIVLIISLQSNTTLQRSRQCYYRSIFFFRFYFSFDHRYFINSFFLFVRSFILRNRRMSSLTAKNESRPGGRVRTYESIDRIWKVHTQLNALLLFVLFVFVLFPLTPTYYRELNWWVGGWVGRAVKFRTYIWRMFVHIWDINELSTIIVSSGS